MEQYLTTQEVATMLRTPVETIYYWQKTKRGPKSFKLGVRRLYALSDVQAFIAEAQGASA